MRALCLLALLPLGAQSPTFRGNAAHTGVAPAPSRPLVGKVAWRHEGLTSARCRAFGRAEGLPMHAVTPAVDGDRIAYAAGPFAFLLDRDGRELRQWQLEGRVPGPVALQGDLLFVLDEDGRMLALDTRKGGVRWKTPVGEPLKLGLFDPWDNLFGGPCLSEGTLYVASADGTVAALAAETGRILWRVSLGEAVRSVPAVAGGRVFLGTLEGKVLALSAQTGARLWTVDTREPGVLWRAVQGSCVVDGNRVLVGSRSTFLYALDAASGRQLWKQAHRGSWVPCTPAVEGGVAYVGQSDDAQMQAVDAQGGVLWGTPVEGACFSSPLVAGEHLYVATSQNYDMMKKGWVAAMDRATGKLRWQLELPASVYASPVMAGDHLLVACSDGNLYAIR